MNVLQKLTVAAVMAAIAIPAMAAEKQHRVCDPTATVEFGQVGEVNETELQNQIDNVKEQMQKVRHARGSHLLQSVEMKRHLLEMQIAMTQLHNQMYADGCRGAVHGASVETRIEVLEKRLGALEQMVSQLVDHLSEQQEGSTE